MAVSQKSKRDAQAIKCIEELYSKHYGRYGVERMTAVLWTDYGLKLNHIPLYILTKGHSIIMLSFKINLKIKIHPEYV